MSRSQPRGIAGVITLALVVSGYIGAWKYLPHELMLIIGWVLVFLAFAEPTREEIRRNRHPRHRRK